MVAQVEAVLLIWEKGLVEAEWVCFLNVMRRMGARSAMGKEDGKIKRKDEYNQGGA